MNRSTHHEAPTAEALTAIIPAAWTVSPDDSEPTAAGEAIDARLLLAVVEDEAGTHWQGSLTRKGLRQTTETHERWTSAAAELAELVAVWLDDVGAGQLLQALELSRDFDKNDPFRFYYGPWMNAVLRAKGLTDEQMVHIIKMAPKLAGPCPYDRDRRPATDAR